MASTILHLVIKRFGINLRHGSRSNRISAKLVYMCAHGLMETATVIHYILIFQLPLCYQLLLYIMAKEANFKKKHSKGSFMCIRAVWRCVMPQYNPMHMENSSVKVVMAALYHALQHHDAPCCVGFGVKQP